MLFSSYVFLFAFLPLTLAGYIALSPLKSAYAQRVFLIAASLVFYGWFSVRYLFLFAASVAGNFLLAQGGIHAKTDRAKRVWLLAAAAGNLLVLGYYKYFDFFVGTVNTLAGTSFALRQIVLPLGISFFTFQQIAFQVQVCRGAVRSLRLTEYVLFVSFFPQLVAGPIVQYGELVPQFSDALRRKPDADHLALGVYTFVLGLFKKLVLADMLADWVDSGFAVREPGMLGAWFCLFAYAFQIYFDFSGYSDMAVGLGKLFNFDLPINFDAPYRSASVREFWRRWHITLGRMLTELVYIPLGGSRKGTARKYVNLLLTFFLSGLWHGASWTFVLWGLLHGGARVLEEVLQKPLRRVPRRLRQAGTFLFTAGAFILFRAESFAQAGKLYGALFRFGTPGFSQFKKIVHLSALGLPASVCFALAAAAVLVCMLLVFRAKPVPERAQAFRPEPMRAVWTAALFLASVLCISRGEVFIYFNF